MNLIWQAYLQNCRAIIRDGRVVSYGNAPAELANTRAASTGSATVLSDLSHFGLIQFSGGDAQSFLQGQLSCDVRQVSSSAALYGSYCNPKGRMLASFLIWRDRDGDDGNFVMQLPSALLAAIQKRLSMYVLRAKVNLFDSSGMWVRMGLAGSGAGPLVQQVTGGIPDSHLGVIHGEHASVIRLAQDRFELIVAPEHASSIAERLSRDAMPVGAPCWDWLEIKAGIPLITPATQEQFVPQMANLDAIGGISFQKGCYPGQEIVSRTQYLGKIKRRMYLANIKPTGPEIPIEAGDELFSADMGEQSSGMVVNAAASPDGGYDVLAVVQISSVGAGKIYWKSLNGPALEIMPLPYKVSQ
ncbi:CAF17-like 4Fe-4S cluster assembly/insertion protein YgfZ [Nitrosovibrio sp. Nv4]|uniref:CAF17-like 4Fe-4S cluster assembly/insertion protein YgfZ n=1 Tax=Nitrosovibrio sp. Nv4 TaxID=1945880 RepID=UPI000BC98DB5|nr:folate-binding protein YgfZ [Nitrosovibrio sp. Nv4]SOD42041.1 hypothetical protein SAMN06298226_2368 [Nitrosovibrio sp. Nv4]